MSGAASIAWLFLLCVVISTSALVPPEPAQAPAVGGSAVVIPTPPPLPTLTQDLDEIYRMIQFKPLNQLLVRYLLNDAQFQAFVRIINSKNGFMARWRLKSQPEVVVFQQWVNQQLMASGGPLELEEGELTVGLVNPFPYWSATVFGWKGFFDELQLYYHQYAIKAHITTKVQQQGIFAQFWARVKALQPVYERWLAQPETQALIGQLQAEGVETALLDQFIREQLDWTPANATTTAAPIAPIQPVEPIVV